MAVAYEHSNEGAKLTAMQGCELTASFDASVKEGEMPIFSYVTTSESPIKEFANRGKSGPCEGVGGDWTDRKQSTETDFRRSTQRTVSQGAKPPQCRTTAPHRPAPPPPAPKPSPGAHQRSGTAGTSVELAGKRPSSYGSSEPGTPKPHASKRGQVAPLSGEMFSDDLITLGERQSRGRPSRTESSAEAKRRWKLLRSVGMAMRGLMHNLNPQVDMKNNKSVYEKDDEEEESAMQPAVSMSRNETTRRGQGSMSRNETTRRGQAGPRAFGDKTSLLFRPLR